MPAGVDVMDLESGIWNPESGIGLVRPDRQYSLGQAPAFRYVPREKMSDHAAMNLSGLRTVY